MKFITKHTIASASSMSAVALIFFLAAFGSHAAAKDSSGKTDRITRASKNNRPGPKSIPTRTPSPEPKAPADTSSRAKSRAKTSAEPHDTPKPVTVVRREKELRSTIRTNKSLQAEVLSAATTNDASAVKARLAKTGFSDVKAVQFERKGATQFTITICWGPTGQWCTSVTVP